MPATRLRGPATARRPIPATFSGVRSDVGVHRAPAQVAEVAQVQEGRQSGQASALGQHRLPMQPRGEGFLTETCEKVSK